MPKPVHITCPHCHQPIDLDDVISHQLQEQSQQQFTAEKEKLLAEHAAKLKAAQAEAETVKAKTQELLQQQEQTLKQKLWDDAKKQAVQQLQASGEKEKQQLLDQLVEQKKRAEQAEETERKVLAQQRQLELERKQLELKVEREVSERLQQEKVQNQKLEAEKLALEAEKFAVKERELKKQIDDMKKLAEEAQRKATTVSQQLQGEAQELFLEDLLQRQFPGDEIAEVKKGQFGADIIQIVKNRIGHAVGKIVWESKQAERFSEKWLAKLRDDQRQAGGQVAVLITSSLPTQIKTCGQLEGVWVTTPAFVGALATALRQGLLDLDHQKVTHTGQDVKMEMLYQYMSGSEFRQRIEAIVETFRELQSDLDREQRSMQLIWKKREKQILRLATSTAYLYGEIQGVLGSGLQDIQGLQLSASVTRAPALKQQPVESLESELFPEE
jgi:hypothetical protein